MNQNETQNRAQQTVNIAEIFLQQSARLLETQAEAVRTVMRAQARSFSALGGPDWSSLYTQENERQFAEFLKTSTDQAVNLMRQTNEAMRQFQEVFSQLVSQQTSQLTAQIRTSAEEIGQRTQQAQRQVLESSQQTAQQARHAAEQVLHGSGAQEERTRSKRPA